MSKRRSNGQRAGLGLLGELLTPGQRKAAPRRCPMNRRLSLEPLEERSLLSVAPFGAEFQVNTFTSGRQVGASLAIDADGDFVVAWASYAQDGSSFGIYAQRFDAAGTAQGSEFRVNSFTTDNQFFPAVAMDADGDFVVAWQSRDQDGSFFGIYAQRFDAAGTPQGSEFRVNSFTAGSQGDPSVAMDADGDFVVAWTSYAQDGSGGDGVYAQRYDAAGTARGSEFRVNSFTDGIQALPAVAMDADGDFVVAWHSYPQDGSGFGIYAQRFDAAGTAQGGEFRVNSFTANDQSSPAAAMDADGDFVVAWDSNAQDGSGDGIYAQRYDAAGAAQGSEFRVNSFTANPQKDPAVAMDADGDFVVAWESKYAQDGSGYGVYAQRYDAAGTVQGSEFRVNSFTANSQSSPTVAMDADGDLIVAWTSNTQDGSSYGIYAQRYTPTRASAAAVNQEFEVNSFTTNNQQDPAVAMAADGDYVVAWESFGQDVSDTFGIYAQRYNAAGEAQGPEFQVNFSTAGDQLDPDVVIDADGNFVVGWSGPDGNGTGIFARRFNALGEPLANEFRVNTFFTDNQARPSLAMNAAGELVVAWDSVAQDGSGRGVFARRYDADGIALGNEFGVNTTVAGDQSHPSAAMNDAGQFVIAWEGPDGSLSGVFAQRFSAGGARVGDEFRVNKTTVDHQRLPAAGIDASGNLVIAWQNFVDAGSGLFDIFARRYSAAGVALGDEFLVPATNQSDQTAPAVTMRAEGDFVIAWESFMQDGSDSGVYAQRYDAAGVPRVGEFQVNITTGGSQRLADLAADAQGNFVVVWQSEGQDGSGQGVFAQRFSVNLPFAGEEFRANSTIDGEQRSAASAMDDAGHFVVAWEGPDGDDFGIFAQRFNAAGQPLGDEFEVNTFTTDNQGRPAVAMDADGDFVIVWESYGQDDDGYGVYARRYSKAGQPLDAQEFQVNADVGFEEHAQVAMDAAGNFVITFDRDDGQTRDVWARRYSAAGVPLAAEFAVAGGDEMQQFATVAVDSDGDFVVAWESKDTDGDGYGIYARRYNAAGQPQGNEFRVNSTTEGNQRFPAASMDADGDFVVAWDGPAGGVAGLWAQRFDRLGAAQGEEFQVNPATRGTQAAVAMDDDGNFVVTWTTLDGGLFGVYARHYDAAGQAISDEFRVNSTILGTQQSPAAAMAADGRHVIVWNGSGPGDTQGIFGQRLRSATNAAPVAQDDAYVVGPSGASTAAVGVLANDTDPDGDTLGAALVAPAARGSLVLNAGGTFTYTPGPGFKGIDSFSYRAVDGTLESDVAAVTLLSHAAVVVQKLYQQVLGRAPELQGWEFWTQRIESGLATLGTIASGIFESDERLDPIIRQMYRDFLFREADAEGLAFWRDSVWKRDGSPDNVIAGIISSPEFFQSAGGTNTGWVTELYRRLLGREPDAAGLDFWTERLDTGALSRPQVVLGFVRSEENFRLLVRGWFLQYLGRSAGQPEEDAFVGQLQGGASQRAIQIQILDSPEYRNTPPPPPAGTAQRI